MFSAGFSNLKRNDRIIPPDSVYPGHSNSKKYQKSPSEQKRLENTIEGGNNTTEGKKKHEKTERKVKKLSKTILWTGETISTLKKIMAYINETKLMPSIGYLVRQYVLSHDKYSEYRIMAIDCDTQDLRKDILILAYICEVYLEKNYEETKLIMTDKLIYRTFGKIISEMIRNTFSYDDWILSFREMYMINLIGETLSPDYKNQSDLVPEVVRSSYFSIKYLMSLLNHPKSSEPEILYSMVVLYLRCEELDLSLFTDRQIKDFLDIIGTKRKLFLKIFIVMSNYMIRRKTALGASWLLDITKLSDLNGLKTMMTDPLMEFLLVMSGNIIKVRD